MVEKKSTKEQDAVLKKEGTTFLKLMIGVMFIPLAIFIAILIFEVVTAPAGIAQETCFRDNFWLTSLNSILISLALITVFPGALIVAGVGIMRLMKKQKLAIPTIIAGLLFAPFNLYLAYIPYQWFGETKEDTLHTNGKSALLKLARAEEREMLKNGAYTKDIKKLGVFIFSDIGTVNITSVNGACFTAVAAHDCMPNNIIFDSCNGRIQE